MVEHGYSVYTIIAEVLMASICRLPRPHDKPVYYSSLIMDLCKDAPQKFPSALGKTIK